MSQVPREPLLLQPALQQGLMTCTTRRCASSLELLPLLRCLLLPRRLRGGQQQQLLLLPGLRPLQAAVTPE